LFPGIFSENGSEEFCLMKQRPPLLDFLLGLCPGIPPLILLLFSGDPGACRPAFSSLFPIASGVYLLEVFFLLFLFSWKKSISNPFLIGVFGIFLFDLLLGGVRYFFRMLCLMN
jgi:hypothetical protein